MKEPNDQDKNIEDTKIT